MNQIEILKNEIEQFKHNIELKYIRNDSNLIYLRLSALDKTKKDPIKDALEKLQADFNSLIDKYSILKEKGFILFVEIKSAYKNSHREEFINLCDNYLFNDITNISEILEGKSTNSIKNVYMSSIDRTSRHFLYGLTFQILKIMRDINIYTLDDNYNKLELDYRDIKNLDSNKQLLYIFQLMIIHKESSKHSEDFSYKVKKRVTKDSKGVTISSKSNKKWGVKPQISDKMKNKIKSLYKNFTSKEISERNDIYKDLTSSKKSISIHTINKIILEK